MLLEGTVLADIHTEAFYLCVRIYFLSPAVYILVACHCLMLSLSQHLEFIIIICHVVFGCPSVHSVEVFRMHLMSPGFVTVQLMLVSSAKEERN